MNRIDTIGNLPNIIAAFVGKLENTIVSSNPTEFYEMESIREFEIKAVDIPYEILPPAVDEKTGRGYLVGLDVDEPSRVDTLVQYVKLRIYFVEASDSEVTAWAKKIKQHRLDQEVNAWERRQRAQDSMKKRNPIIIEGE